MKTIHRFKIGFGCTEINIHGLAEKGIQVPFKDQILKIDVIRGIPSIWCLVDTDIPEEPHRLMTYGTGWPVGADVSAKDYVGSFIFSEYGEIYHVFLEE